MRLYELIDNNNNYSLMLSQSSGKYHLHFQNNIGIITSSYREKIVETLKHLVKKLNNDVKGIMNVELTKSDILRFIIKNNL